MEAVIVGSECGLRCKVQVVSLIGEGSQWADKGQRITWLIGFTSTEGGAVSYKCFYCYGLRIHAVEVPGSNPAVPTIESMPYGVSSPPRGHKTGIRPFLTRRIMLLPSACD